MLRLIVQILAGLAAAALLSLSLHWLLGVEGETVIVSGGLEISQPTSQFILLLLLLVAVLLVGIEILRRGLGGFLAMFDFFRSRRRARGATALSNALIAIAEGDGARSLREAERAERLLDNPDLTRLVGVQAALLVGDEGRAERHFEAMTRDPDTDFLGVQGLLRQALRRGQPERALRLAERAHALRPKDGETLDALFDLQRRRGDWEGARRAIDASVRASRLPRDVGDRRRAVLFAAEAKQASESGDASAARAAAVSAVKLAPGLTPAAVLAARLMNENDERRAAARCLVNAWRAAPHPDLAAGFAALEPDESLEARRKRFERLFGANPDAVETRLLRAELAIAAQDLDAARAALGDLAEAGPTARACALMAAIEQAGGAPETVVRGWLSKAAAAPRGARWICDNCGGVAGEWAHECPRCSAFDALSWKAAEGVDGLAEAALFPLLAAGVAPADALSSPTRVKNVESPVVLAARETNGALETGVDDPVARHVEDMSGGDAAPAIRPPQRVDG